MLPDISFGFEATLKVDTKRAALDTGWANYLFNVPCLPLAPLDAQTQQRLDLKTPHMTWQTYMQGDPDVKKGDILVIDSVEYPVRYVAKWPWLDNTTRLHVVLEDLRS